MPIYEYECSLCGHRLEVLQGISEPLLTDCPSCRRAGLKKLMSAAGFRLSGGGWYETDFKTGNKRNLAADASSSGADGAAKLAGAGNDAAAPGKPGKPGDTGKAGATGKTGKAGDTGKGAKPAGAQTSSGGG